MIACAPGEIQPLTEIEAHAVMRQWIMHGNTTFQAASGAQMLLAMSHSADQLASALVVSGYGVRRWHAIELNAAGVALWQQEHPA